MKIEQVKKYVIKKLPSRVIAQRITKATVNSTVAFILCLVPSTLSVLGGEPAMLPLISVMVHPGRRFGSMLEGIVFCSTGLLVGNAYSLLGRFIAQCILGNLEYLPDQEQLEYNYDRYRAALAVLAVFHILMLFFHGWMRVISHKFFGIVFPLFLVVHFTFTDNLNVSAGTIAKNFTVPFFVGIAISLACNLVIFPEFGSSYFGTSMSDILNELHETLDYTLRFFNQKSTNYTQEQVTLAQLIKKKTTLRSKLNATQGVLKECTYEISYSYCSPSQAKPLIEILKTQLSYTCALINASQLHYTTAMNNSDNDQLENVLSRTDDPLFKLHQSISRCLYIVKLSIAQSYDVKVSKMAQPEYFTIEEIDMTKVNFESEVRTLARDLSMLDLSFRKEFTLLSNEFENYLTPNDNMFILSSFLMNLKETTNSVINMMNVANNILQVRLKREKKGIFGRRIWMPFIKSREDLKGWFEANHGDFFNSNESASLNGAPSMRIYTGDVVEPEKSHSDDESTTVLSTNEEKKNFLDSLIVWLLKLYHSHSAHIRFGLQCAVALTLATFPMFVPEARHWFVDIRGPWIGFVCILVVEPEVGSTFFVFFLRGVGVISGAAWGYLSYVAGDNQNNPYLETVVTVIGAIPGFYFFLGTPYIKAAIIGVISIYIVILSAALPSEVGGSILVNFGKRCLAMIYGGAVALICQIGFFPNKARDELIKEVVYSTGNISKILLLYAAGLDGETVQVSLSEKRFHTLQRLSSLTSASLIRADAYRISAKKEPRLKGSYHQIEKIFFEIIFILRQILERVENIVQLRRSYGSAIVEELNDDVFPYRRQLIASMNNTVKAVEFALLTKSPLPQYLPSCTVAQKRLIAKVSDVIKTKYKRKDSIDDSSDEELVMDFGHRKQKKILENQQENVLKERFLSWNASSAATEEIVEYIEELVELTKVLVGVNEFKYGFLSRSLYSEYAAKAVRGYEQLVPNNNDNTTQDEDDDSDQALDDDELNPVAFDDVSSIANTHKSAMSEGFRKRVYSIGSWIRGDEQSTTSMGQFYDDSDEEDGDEQLPLSLMRVASRRGGNS